jgi:hypothetical protein
MKIIVQRIKETVDGYLGMLSLDFDSFTCYTVENKKKSIPAGIYNVTFQMSKKFKRMTPHIDVPHRTFIEIHNANYPSQLEGCIAVGDKIDGDAVNNSMITDIKLESILKNKAGLQIQILDIV